MDKTVSLIITSCDRFDLLEKTLESLFKHNTYTLNQLIIIEDSGKKTKLEKVVKKFNKIYDITTVVNEIRLGQLKSIDKVYNMVTSEYIFHCEEDWNFIKPEFIEKSIEILENNEKILSVWLRALNEYDVIEFSDDIHTTNNIEYKLVHNDILSFNPGLRRLKDYKLINNFAQYQQKGFESHISEFYIKHGFVSAILLEPYVEHLGWHRRVLNATKERNNLIYTMDNFTKKIKSNLYRLIGIGKFKWLKELKKD